MSKRLTKEDRQNFVDGVLRDTPNKTSELIKAIVDAMEQVIKKETPKEVYALWLNPELREYVQSDSINADSEDWRSTSVRYPQNYKSSLRLKDKPSVIAARQALAEYKEERKELSTQLFGMIGGFTTVKAAMEGLPEFAKYLPADTKPAYAVAVVAANVVANLNKAGWPDKKKK